MWQSIFPMVADFLPKALLAILCGGLVGVERAMRRKPAGFRTNILICLGSMLFTWLSIRVALILSAEAPGDPARIAAQVVTGIGFLGAGAIIQSRGYVRGLTSAAMIWVVAAIGMSIGVGLGGVAVICTVLVLVVQFGLGLVERRFFGRCVFHNLEVVFDDQRRDTRDEIERALQLHGSPLDQFHLQPAGEHVSLTLQYCTVHPHHRKIINSLLRIGGVREVRPLH
jgi:putative Mg2+ transporter-C (MgtC) family protein